MPASNLVVEGAGFEPAKAMPSDLQSDPFGHSGTPPDNFLPLTAFKLKFKADAKKNGAGGRNRTPDLLITSQLLYQLSYASFNPLNLRGRYTTEDQ